MKRYVIYSCYTAGLQFAKVAKFRGNCIKLVTHHANPLISIYEKSFPGDVLCFNNILDEDLLGALSSYKPHFLVSSVFDRKIPQSHINLATNFAVNIHPSRLPEIRTGDSAFWNILLERSKFGITMHHLTQEWDCGDILLKKLLPLNRYETEASLIKKVEDYMQSLSYEFQDILENPSQHSKKYKGSVKYSYYPKIKASKISLTMLEDPKFIEKLVRASNPSKQILLKIEEEKICLKEIELTNKKSTKKIGTLESIGKELFINTIGNKIQIKFLYSEELGFVSAQRFIILKNPDGKIVTPCYEHLQKVIYDLYRLTNLDILEIPSKAYIETFSSLNDHIPQDQSPLIGELD